MERRDTATDGVFFSDMPLLAAGVGAQPAWDTERQSVNRMTQVRQRTKPKREGGKNPKVWGQALDKGGTAKHSKKRPHARGLPDERRLFIAPGGSLFSAVRAEDRRNGVFLASVPLGAVVAPSRAPADVLARLPLYEATR